MSNKRTAERQLRPVFEPSAELVTFCQHVTRNQMYPYSSHQLGNWASRPAILQYARRNGTPFAYEVLTDSLYSRFTEGILSWRAMVAFVRQGAYVPNMSQLCQWFRSAHAGFFHLEDPDEDEDEDEDGDDSVSEEQELHNQKVRANIRKFLPAVAEAVEDKCSLPYTGGVAEPDVQCPLFTFIHLVHHILCPPLDLDEDAEALRPLFWDVLETLMNRGFDFEEADISGDTPRLFLERWDNTQAARLFDPVILK